MAKFDRNLFGIIGLGRFGTAVAKQLLDDGKRIIAIDRDPSALEPLKNLVDQIYPIEQINKTILEDAGIGECGTVIVGIGRDIENSLLASLNAIELGVPRVIAKANSSDHARLLSMLGAEVVFPEVDMGIRLARSLGNRMVVDFLSLCENFSIIEVEISGFFIGKTVLETEIRKKYGCTIIAILRGKSVVSAIMPSTKLEEHDILVLSGTNENLTSFQKANAK